LSGLLAAPASYFQRLHLERSHEGHLVHNVSVLWRLRGNLDPIGLRAALAEIVARHEVLRSGLREMAHDVVQVIASEVEVSINDVDLRNIPPAKRWRAFEQLVREETARAFKLTTPPLLRVTLARLACREQVLVITTSHAIWDGWSTSIALDEFTTLYAAVLSGEPPDLPPLELQFADHVAHATALQQRTQQPEAPVCRLRLSRARLAKAQEEQIYRSAALRFTAASPAVTRQLQAVASRHRSTLAMVVLAAMAILLRVAIDEDPARIALNDANRDEPSSRLLIGPFLSFLLVQVAVDPALTYADALGRTRDGVMDAYQTRRFLDERFRPFEERSRPWTPVIHDAWLNFFPLLQPFAAASQPRNASGLLINPLGTQGASESRWNDGALGLTVHEAATGGLEATFVYDASLLTRAEVEELALVYRRTLVTLSVDPERRVATARRGGYGSRLAVDTVMSRSVV